MKALGALIPMFCLSASADVIYMKNGDRITGEIKEIWDDSVTIEAPYTDDFDIDLKDVASMKTDERFHVSLYEGDENDYKLARSDVAGKVILQSGEDRVLVALTDLKKVEEIESFYDWGSKVDLSQSVSRGNTDSFIYNLNGVFKLKWGDHRTNFDLSMVREEQNGNKLKDKDRLFASYDWIFSKPWFLAANLTLERDPIVLLDQRTSVNPALGYDIWDDPWKSMNVQLGGGLQNETIDGKSQSSSLVEWRFRYAQDFRGGDFELFHNHLIYRSLGGRENLVFNSVTGIRYDITDDIYLNIQLNYDVDTEPVEGTEGEDLTLLFGAGIDF